MTDQVHKEVGQYAVIGRRFRDSKSHHKREGESIRVLPTAFIDVRPGHLSFDVFWSAQPQPKSAEVTSLLARAVAVCASESYPVIGWACFRSDQLLAGLKTMIVRIVHSPTETNPMHGHIETRQFLAVTPDDPENEFKAFVLGKALSEFHAAKGEIHWTAPRNRNSALLSLE